MEEVPIEILEIILSHVYVLPFCAQVNCLFNTLCKRIVTPCKTKEELERAIKDNDISRIKLSDNIIEDEVNEVVRLAKDNKPLLRYLLDFVHPTSLEMFYLDDISLVIKFEPIFMLKAAAQRGAIKIFTHVYSTLVDREVTDIKHDIINYGVTPDLHEELTEILIDQQDILCYFKPVTVAYYACVYRNVDALKYGVMDTSAFFQAESKNFVQPFELYYVDNPQMYITGACMNNSTDVIDRLLHLGAEFNEECMRYAITSGHADLVKRISNKVELTSRDLYSACEYGNRDIVMFIMNKVQHDDKRVYRTLKLYRNYELLHELFPNDESRLLRACLLDDIITVKELYPHYSNSLFNTILNASYEMCEILYREGDFTHFMPDGIGRIKFYVERGFKTPQEMLGFCDTLEEIKYIVGKGASPQGMQPPRIQRWLDTI